VYCAPSCAPAFFMSFLSIASTVWRFAEPLCLRQSSQHLSPLIRFEGPRFSSSRVARAFVLRSLALILIRGVDCVPAWVVKLHTMNLSLHQIVDPHTWLRRSDTVAFATIVCSSPVLAVVAPRCAAVCLPASNPCGSGRGSRSEACLRTRDKSTSALQIALAHESCASYRCLDLWLMFRGQFPSLFL
jgi:hypothetical protein